MDLEDTELRFLARHGLSVSDVLDGRLYRSDAERKRMAKEQGKALVLGTRCSNGGHRLRTRAGHCAQCKPINMTFEARHCASGYVYIARSLMKNLVKVGSTDSVRVRQHSLRSQRYAGADDWEIPVHKKCANAGKVEADTMRLLKKYKVKGETYRKDGKDQVAYEVFGCDFLVAENALDEAIKTNEDIDGIKRL